jgi:hypothetical protein
VDRRFIGLLCVLVATACGHNTVTRSGDPHPARDQKCDFDVFTTPPANGYTEIATLDIKEGFWGDNAPSDIKALKKSIQRDVCGVGGDAVIAYANGFGDYVKASVLKRAWDTGPQPAPAAHPSPAAAAPAAAEAGCQYDTQCKGDRVCVSGECVDPAPSTAVPSAAAPAAAGPALPATAQ